MHIKAIVEFWGELRDICCLGTSHTIFKLKSMHILENAYLITNGVASMSGLLSATLNQALHFKFAHTLFTSLEILHERSLVIERHWRKRACILD